MHSLQKTYKNRIRLLLILIALLIISAFTILNRGCTNKTVKFTESESGYFVRLRTGDNIEITLPSSPSSGYSWTISSYDTAVLKLTDAPNFVSGYSTPEYEGKTLYKFKVKGPGKTKIVMEYGRSWLKNSKPLKVYDLGVLAK